jgi:mutator protein MutT
VNPVPIEVSAGVLVRDGRILITRRPPGSHLAGLWEFPGGKRQPGESWEACLVRELEEEIDVTVAVGALRFETVHHYPGKSVHLRFFDCTWVRGEPRPVECAEVAWVRPAELARHSFPEADRELVARLASSGI